MNELIIDEINFSQYFRDCRISRPERGDVIAKYNAIAELSNGQLKMDLVDLLHKNKVNAAIQVMRKLGCSSEKDAVKVCKQLCGDLIDGRDVFKKDYEFVLEMFYYTKKEYVPQDDVHWSIISIKNLDEFLDKSGEKLSFNYKIIDDQPKIQ